MQTLTAPTTSGSKDPRFQAFGRALDALRAEVEAQVGSEDLAHIKAIQALSNKLEIFGRTLIHVSFDPITFSAGVTALTAHKCLELMELGHMVLHGAYDKIEGADDFRSETYRWKAPIDEASWRHSHNIRHHQYTNIEGRDPDIDFGGLRLSARVPFRLAHRLQPVTNVLSWMVFTNAINAHATGMIEIYLPYGEPTILKDRSKASRRAAQRAFWSKAVRYHAREYVFFPLLAGPFFWKTLLGNALSELGKDLYAGTIIYCGHVGARDFPADAHAKGRAHWYAMQAEAASDIELPHFLSVLCGGLDRQIEHHLFPRLPPNRLREIAPRVRALCEEYGVTYRSAPFAKSLASVFGKLKQLASPAAAAPIAA